MKQKSAKSSSAARYVEQKVSLKDGKVSKINKVSAINILFLFVFCFFKKEKKKLISRKFCTFFFCPRNPLNSMFWARDMEVTPFTPVRFLTVDCKTRFSSELGW